jgi:uncharacterized membrane protein (DUF373 family)
MKWSLNWIGILRKISSILLLLSVALQIVIVALLEVFEDNIEDFELDEIHEVTGFVFLGLILAHTVLYWKSIRSLFTF